MQYWQRKQLHRETELTVRVLEVLAARSRWRGSEGTVAGVEKVTGTEDGMMPISVPEPSGASTAASIRNE